MSKNVRAGYEKTVEAYTKFLEENGYVVPEADSWETRYEKVECSDGSSYDDYTIYFSPLGYEEAKSLEKKLLEKAIVPDPFSWDEIDEAEDGSFFSLNDEGLFQLKGTDMWLWVWIYSDDNCGISLVTSV